MLSQKRLLNNGIEHLAEESEPLFFGNVSITVCVELAHEIINGLFSRLFVGSLDDTSARLSKLNKLGPAHIPVSIDVQSGEIPFSILESFGLLLGDNLFFLVAQTVHFLFNKSNKLFILQID